MTEIMGYLQSLLLGFLLISLVNCKPFGQDDENDSLRDGADDNPVNPSGYFSSDGYTGFQRRKYEAGKNI